MSMKPISDGVNRKQLGPGCAVAFFIVFALFGLAFTVIVFLPAWRGMDQSKSWAPTPCTIVSSELRISESKRGTTYTPAISYTYTFGRQKYRSSRYQFLTEAGSRATVQAIVDRYRTGTRATCYVDPNNPREAVIERTMSRGGYWTALIPMAFVLVGVIGAVATLRSAARRRRGLATGAPFPPLVSRGPVSPTLRPAGSSGPVVRHTKRGGQVVLFVFVTVFACIWNGAIWAGFILPAFARAGHGTFDLCSSLFMIPFALVGMAVAIGAIYLFLALFNPGVQLTLSAADVPLGGTLDVEWDYLGHAGRIRQLTVTFEGREEATYRRGTNTSTDRNVFLKMRLVDTAVPSQINRGRTRIVVPLETMHSFASPSNRVIWSLKLHGEIPLWPDVNDSFDISVLPIPPQQLARMLNAEEAEQGVADEPGEQPAEPAPYGR